MEAKGRVIQVMPTESGITKAGKGWSKTTFVIETGGEYPKKIAIDVMGDKVQLPNVGEDVTVSLNIESREYNGKWYSNVNAWKVETGAGQSAPTAPTAPSANPSAKVAAADDDLPF
jgi:single-stranded DNA-binding protein